MGGCRYPRLPQNRTNQLTSPPKEYLILWIDCETIPISSYGGIGWWLEGWISGGVEGWMYGWEMAGSICTWVLLEQSLPEKTERNIYFIHWMGIKGIKNDEKRGSKKKIWTYSTNHELCCSAIREKNLYFIHCEQWKNMYILSSASIRNKNKFAPPETFFFFFFFKAIGIGYTFRISIREYILAIIKINTNVFEKNYWLIFVILFEIKKKLSY